MYMQACLPGLLFRGNKVKYPVRSRQMQASLCLDCCVRENKERCLFCKRYKSMIYYLTIYKFIDCLFAIFNFFSDLLFFFKFKIKKVLKKNRELKNCKKGESCFILGNGPSLKNVDLQQLKNKDTFTCNMFYKDKNLNGFFSTYYAALDPNMYLDDNLQYIKEISDHYPSMKFFLKLKAEKLKNWDDSRVYYVYTKKFQEHDRIDCNLTGNLTAASDIVTHCIQIAIYMGYKNIYLLGADFSNYAQLKTTHFSADYPGDDKETKNVSMGADALNAAREHFHHYALRTYADKHGINIINLTPNSLIDAYKRDTLEHILQKDSRISKETKV